MDFRTQTITLKPGAVTGVTIPISVARIVRATLYDTANGATELTVVATAAGAGDIEFTGTPDAPASAATLGAAAGATDSLELEVVPQGAIPSYL